jgi:hypothetical protein
VRVFLALSLAVELSAFCAWAEDHPTARSVYLDNPVSFGLQVAPMGSPGGLLALAFDVAVLPELSLAAVGGLGTAGSVWQLGVAARPRIPLTQSVAFDLTAGVSRGDYDRIINVNLATGGNTEQYRNCTWLNIDLGPEARFSSHVLLHLFAGFSQLVASDAPVLVGNGYLVGYEAKRWPSLPYVGLTVGYFGP